MAEGSGAITPSNESGSGHSSDFEIAGDTFSIASNITQYRVENGRRYHAYRDGAYWAPNDDKQNENLDINHHLFSLMQGGKLHLAPLEKDIEKVLDVGTGTGIWAIDFSDEFPNTTVLGTDLSPIQPDLVPPNCRFEVDDCTDEWVYPENYFDYIHIRTLFGCIEDWDALYAKAYKHLKPGGYIEHFEISTDIKSDDNTVKPDSALRRFSEMYDEASAITGIPFVITKMMKPHIKQAGFENVVERVLKAPLGGWPADIKLREIGMWLLLSVETGLEGWAMATLTRVLGWSANEVHVFLVQVRKEAKDRKIHSYYEVAVVYGQKPLIPNTRSSVDLSAPSIGNQNA